MAKPKTIQQAADNLRRVAPLIGQRYTVGINNADWQTPAASEQAEQNWSTGVQRAAASGARRSGILAVTNESWRQAAVAKGASVIGERITGAIQKYMTNFAPILTAMSTAAQALPPRTASAQQNVTNRLIPVIRAAVEASGKTFS